MLDYLNTLSNQVIQFSKGNQVVSGVVGLWGLGVFTYLMRELPGRIWVVLVKQFTVRVVINSNDEAFYNIIKWYESEGFSKKARTLRLSSDHHSVDGSTKHILSAGYGYHYFFFGHYPFRLQRSKEDNGSKFLIIDNLELVTIGRSQTPLRKILNATDPQINSAQMTKIFKWDEGGWSFSHSQLVRSLNSIILEDEVRKKLLTHLAGFKSDKDWYHQHGIPYRTGICLYGPPGTGKTSLVRSICGLDERDLYILNLNTINDKGIEAAIDTIGKNSVLLIEDIDSFGPTLKRDSSKNKSTSSETSGLTLSGILNSIDGITASDGRILILTTNNLNALDNALLRPGRIDLLLELGPLNHQMIHHAFKKFFPHFHLPPIHVKDSLTPAQFQNLVMRFRDSPELVLADIIE